jgi:hypothetical protein
MPEPTQIVFTHKEVVEALVRKHSIREGIWGLYMRFGIKGANVGSSSGDIQPAAIIPILEIGLQKMDEVNNISVDASTLKTAESSAAKRPKGRGR